MINSHFVIFARIYAGLNTGWSLSLQRLISDPIKNFFAKMNTTFITASTKSSVIDVWQSPIYASEIQLIS